MAPRHAIELALDLARMPALARSSAMPPIPQGVIELMRIAAGSQEACENAATVTGEPKQVLIEAAQFYLQQLLFRPEADCYRVLGVEPGASRATIRSHMRWLLLWLHPDRNKELNAVYAERVLKAWHEIDHRDSGVADPANRKPSGAPGSFRMPWIKYPKRRRQRGTSLLRRFTAWSVSLGLVLLIVIWSIAHYFGFDQTSATNALIQRSSF